MLSSPLLSLSKGVLFRKTHTEMLAAHHWIGLLMPKTYDLHASCGVTHQIKHLEQASPSGPPQKKH